MCFGIQHLPGQPRHRLHGVRAADADRARAEAAGVRRVRVGADDQRARESVLLQDDLVDDAGARAPEAGAVLGGRGRQEVVDLAVLGERLAQVRPGPRRAPGSGGRSGSWSAPRRGARRVCMNWRRRSARARPGVRPGRGAGTGSSCPAPAPGVSGSSRWPSRTLSARVSGRPSRRRTTLRLRLHGLVDLGGHFGGRFDVNHTGRTPRFPGICRVTTITESAGRGQTQRP